MNTGTSLRGRGALVALAALSTTTGVAYAAAPETASVSMADRGAEKVRYGSEVRIAGSVEPGARGEIVELEYAARGNDYRPVARRKTRAGGSFRFTPRVTRSGAYRTVVDEDVESRAKRVTVVAEMSGRATRHVLGGRVARVRGKLMPSRRGRTVKLQRASRGKWRTVDTVRTRSGGRFSARFNPDGPGVYKLRVRSVGDRLSAAAGERLPRVRAYRAGHASYYGPGLYGNSLACGGTLTPSTLGVAHKSLPCGTRVTFRYRGRTATVRVIDRGPYVAGREWDLTEATKNRLGFPSTGTVWSTR